MVERFSIHRDECDENKRLLLDYLNDREKFHAPDVGAAASAASCESAAPIGAAASSAVTITVLYTPNVMQVTPAGYIFILPRGPTALYLKRKLVEAHFSNYYVDEVMLTKTGIDTGIDVLDDEISNEDTTLVARLRRRGEPATESSDNDDDDSDDNIIIIETHDNTNKNTHQNTTTDPTLVNRPDTGVVEGAAPEALLVGRPDTTGVRRPPRYR